MRTPGKIATFPWLPLVLGGIGTIAIFVVLLHSTGSNDVRTWEEFALFIRTSGLWQLYEATQSFNHPPLMGIYAWLSLESSSFLGVPFPVIFKFPPVLASISTAIVLGAIWTSKSDLHTGVWAFALYSCALCAVLVAAYHGNTDCICAFLCLLILYYLRRGAPGKAGLALALAVNVKIIPLLLALPILASFRSWRDAGAFCLSASIGAIPFLIAWIELGETFVDNVFGYGSLQEPWGIRVLLLQVALLPDVSPQTYEQLVQAFNIFGKTILIQAIILLSVYGYWRRMDATSLMACAFALFLVLTPGFGVQYVVYLAPLTFAVALGWGFAYATISGLFIGIVYAHFQTNAFPFESVHTGAIPLGAALLGFAVWWTVLCFLVVCLWRNPTCQP